MQIKGIHRTRQVFIDGQEIAPNKSQQVYNHSPDGFNWGYGGSGPAQLALAILLEATDEKEASRLYHSFKWEIISRLPSDFVIDIDINNWIQGRDELCSGL